MNSNTVWLVEFDFGNGWGKYESVRGIVLSFKTRETARKWLNDYKATTYYMFTKPNSRIRKYTYSAEA